MEIDRHRQSKGCVRVQWGIAILVNTIVFTYGLQSGWVSPMINILQSKKSPAGQPLTDSEISLIAGASPFFAMVAIPILLYLVDTYGRKPTLLVMSVFQFLCWMTKICSSTFTSLLVARALCGFGAAGCFTVVPMYVKEISQDNIRGTLGTIFILFLNLGIFTMFALGAYLDYCTVLFAAVGIPILTIAGILFIAPETPPFLVKEGKHEEAAKAIARLRSINVEHNEVQTEMDSIKIEEEYYKSIPNVSLFNIFKQPAWRRGFIIMIMIITIHGCNGAVAIVSYAATILVNSHVDISLEIQSLCIPVVMTIGTLITMIFIDSLGRKWLLAVTFFVSAVAFFGLGYLMWCQDHGLVTPGWMPVVAILITVCCYGAGINPLPFIISSELFNFQIRGKFMAILSFFAWFWNFFQLISFTAITNFIGAYVSFFIFSLLNLIGTALVVLILPETRGKSVEQIEAELRNKKKVGK